MRRRVFLMGLGAFAGAIALPRPPSAIFDMGRGLVAEPSPIRDFTLDGVPFVPFNLLANSGFEPWRRGTGPFRESFDASRWGRALADRIDAQLARGVDWYAVGATPVGKTVTFPLLADLSPAGPRDRRRVSRAPAGLPFT